MAADEELDGETLDGADLSDSDMKCEESMTVDEVVVDPPEPIAERTARPSKAKGKPAAKGKG